MTTENTRGLLAMLSQALSKSKEPAKSDGEPAATNEAPPETDVEVTSPPATPADENIAAADDALPAPLEAEAPSPKADGLTADPPPTARPAHSYKVSVDEAHDIILRGLQRLPDFPSQGVSVTLYGSRPWNAMLTFAPGSTSHRNATTFRSALVEMVADLRKQIDVDHGD